MHLRQSFCGLMLAASLTACGLYTNIPAQIKVATSDQVSASVTYKVDQNQITADVINPKVSLEGEPGSIGVTYDTITIEYLPNTLNIQPNPMVIRTSIRVPSSHQFGENNQIIVGKVETEIPVISSNVVQLGNPLSEGRINSQISAKVTLSGTDDAGFPASKDIFIPINFLSNVLPRT